MARSSLEVADIFRQHGAAWRLSHQGQISRAQYKVMSAIECCRSAIMGGHVLRCTHCKQWQIAYNSCRNRHCPKCQASAAKRWLEKRQADLLPVEYFHVVFTLPDVIADIAYQNKATVYNLLFKAASETLLTIAKDPKRLGARIGTTMVLHTWGSALTHHPHVHCVVPGGGLSPDGEQWIACRPGFFLPVRVLSRLFRRLFLAKLMDAYERGELLFFGKLIELTDTRMFAKYLAPVRQQEWVVYAKEPFAGPKAVLAYLSRYTHRIAISNNRLLAVGSNSVSFKWKDYRSQKRGDYQQQAMTLSIDEFIRRFLIHVLPTGFHRIRYYGILSNTQRAKNISRARGLLNVDREPAAITPAALGADNPISLFLCPSCNAPMIIVDVFKRGHNPRAPPSRRVKACVA
ncbi:MAG: IS91 family transposase [Moraxellaceae bacterium]|nr:MAG: IS91 family transposase [Moraxellaceae bacterium]